MKKFFGGIFVILHIALGLFFCFEGLITPIQPSIGTILCVWALFTVSVFVYPIGRSVYKTQNFTMIAGFEDMNKNYNKPVCAEFFRQVTIWWCFFGFLFSALYLFLPLLGKNEQFLLSGLTVVGDILGMLISYAVLYSRFADRMIIKEGAETR